MGREFGHLENLNPEQLKAVQHFEGPILILAGAGTGKTRVLTNRVAQLVLEHRVPPQRILAITFTNKATEEMRRRLATLLGERANKLWVTTFHAAGLKILRRHAQLLGYANDFVVYDEQDTRSLLKDILKKLDLDDRRYSPGMFSAQIDQAKNQLLTPEEYAKVNDSFEQRYSVEVYDHYQRGLMAANAMDFGDLLLNTALLLKRFPQALELYRSMIEFILVDEFQDTNLVQYFIVQALAEPRQNLLVVGDDDQSIYAFRGATISNILEFEKNYPRSSKVTLEQNYRSTTNVLEVAHAVISKNPARKPKKLWTERDQGAPIYTYVGYNESDEADFVAEELRQLNAAGCRYNECAIFYRTNAQSRALEEALIANEIPYRIYGGLKFYERKEIKDILAYLRLLANPSDNQAFLRVLNTPPRGIGAQTVKQLALAVEEHGGSLWSCASAWAPQHKKIGSFVELIEKLRALAKTALLSELITETIEVSGYSNKLSKSADPQAQMRLENLLELQAIAHNYDNTEATPWECLQSFLDRVALTASDEHPEREDQAQQSTGMVSLMTLHLAKGLEFEVVFMTGMEEGLVPHYRSFEEAGGLEEERRLCYVGITRAMRLLYLTRAMVRSMFYNGLPGTGTSLFREPSRFVADIPEQFLVSKGGEFLKQSLGAEVKLYEDPAEHETAEEPSIDEASSLTKTRKRKPKPKDIRSLLKTADEL